MSSRIIGLVLVLAIACAGPARAAKPQPEPLAEKVRKAIEEGRRYLRGAQVQTDDGKGHWETARAHNVRGGGLTSLVLLALLTAGEKPDDPVIQRGLKYLRGIEPRDTYVVGLQTMVFAEAGQVEDIGRIQQNVTWLAEARTIRNNELQGWGYTKSSGADNSNTQYALLGLWAGKNAGAKIDRAVWESIRTYYIRTQGQHGDWAYSTHDTTPRLSMTTAGLCGLLISGMEVGDRKACGQYKENEPIAKGISWIGKSFQITRDPRSVFYNMYGIERAGRLSGYRYFGQHDWYREGCEFLIGKQQDDGSWSIGQSFDSVPLISSSFALLFLSKGRTPVLISKLVHGDDWNNDRNDARNLVEYASKEMFKRQPLAWQVFNARDTGSNDPDALAAELLQSPIAYFNGHKSPNSSFTGTEEKMIQQYIEQGGFLFAEACCGQKAFDEGFRQLMKRLFPDSDLKKLPPEHPIWQAHAKVPPDAFELWGIEHGCKTVVVYSPQDLSCLWEANDVKGQGQLAFRMGGNIIAYATGMELPQVKGTKVDLVKVPDGEKVPRNYLKVAQLRHDGDWHSAPKAMRNLMLHLRDKAALNVALQTQDLFPDDKALPSYKFMYMHGRADFNLDNVGILRANLERGGLLFADACCGKEAFDKGFRKLVTKLFPDKKLEPIPLDDLLFSKDLNGTAIATVRCRREGQGEYKEVAPFLEGIKIGNRWVVIYSKYDIGCALEKHQSSDCRGHDHASAIRLGTAAVLYALKR